MDNGLLGVMGLGLGIRIKGLTGHE